MKLTGAQAMVKCLEEEGVSVVFGYPGAAICPFYDALISSQIHHVLVRQEQNSGHAASGYARASGRASVCIATSGPGATNLITALATAYTDSVPVVAITGQVATTMLGRDVFQEADITGAAEPFTKYSFLVKSADELPAVFKKAFYIAASGRPGPVLIDIPVDVQCETLDFAYPEAVNIRGYKPSVKGNPAQILRVVAALNEAKRPVLCAGGGVILSHAEREVLALSMKCSVPVVTTMMGLGTVPTFYPLNLGMLGMHGTKAADTAVNTADLLIIVGARAGNRAVVSPTDISQNKKIIHIDVDPAEIGKNVETTIPLVGNAQLILEEVVQRVQEQEHPEWVAELLALKEPRSFGEDTGPLNPRLFFDRLSSQLDQDAILVSDVGQNQIWAATSAVMKRGRFITTGGMGTMGYGLPAAVGAQLAAPGRQVVMCCGDGALQMSMMELATVMQERLPIKLVLMNNSRLGMVRELQHDNYGGRYIAVDISGLPDFIQLAAAYGIHGCRISKNEEIDAAVQQLLNAKGAFLLECIVSPDEKSL